MSRCWTQPLRHACGVPPPLPRGGFGIPQSFPSQSKVFLSARGSPTRGAVERSETERLYEGEPDREPLLNSTSPSRLRRATSPTEGRLWQAGSLSTGRLRFDRTQKGGPCLRGQRLLDNAPCQAVAGLDSGALPFPIYCALLVQTKAGRHANGSPFGGAGGRKPD